MISEKLYVVIFCCIHCPQSVSYDEFQNRVYMSLYHNRSPQICPAPYFVATFNSDGLQSHKGEEVSKCFESYVF